MSLKHSFSESARPTLTPPVPPEGSEQMQTNALFAVAPLPDVDLTLSAWLVSVSMTKMPLFWLKIFVWTMGIIVSANTMPVIYFYKLNLL